MDGHDSPAGRIPGSTRNFRALSFAGSCIELWDLQRRECLKSSELPGAIVNFSVDWEQRRILTAVPRGTLELRSPDDLALQHARHEDVPLTRAFVVFHGPKGSTCGLVSTEGFDRREDVLAAIFWDFMYWPRL